MIFGARKCPSESKGQSLLRDMHAPAEPENREVTLETERLTGRHWQWRIFTGMTRRALNGDADTVSACLLNARQINNKEVGGYS